MEYCVEIMLKNKDGSDGKEGSGYTLKPHWILTAYHVLFGEGVDTDKEAEITLKWPKAHLEDENKQEPPKRKDIEWYSEEVDLALIKCNNLPFKTLPDIEKILLRRVPFDEPGWCSYGFLSTSVDRNGNRTFKPPKGKMHILNKEQQFVDLLIIENDQKKAKEWKGFSGSPVFINRHLLGIISQAQSGKNLTASSLWYALNNEKNKKLVELLEIDLNDTSTFDFDLWFKENFKQRIQCLSDLGIDSIKIFKQKNPNHKFSKTDDGLCDYIIKSSKSSPSEIVDFTEDIFNSLGKNRTNEINKAMYKLAVLMLSIVYPAKKQIKDIHKSRKSCDENNPIQSKTVDKCDTEIVLSLADGQLSSIYYKYSREGKGTQYYPYNITQKNKRLGLDKDAKEVVDEITKKLISKYSIDTNIIYNLLGEVFPKNLRGFIYSSNIEKKINIFVNLVNDKKRRFYIIINDNKEYEESMEYKESWKYLQKRFNNIDLIKLGSDSTCDLGSPLFKIEKILCETYT